MAEHNGLERFRHLVNPSAVKDILSWRGHAELSRLLGRLEAITDQEKFLNTFAEAMIARHLLRQGCRLRVELPTPAGKSADFEVTAEGQRFFLHLKRVSSDRPMERKLTVSSRLRSLERIKRPYVVNVRWQEGLADDEMRRLVASASAFIAHARVGDELIVHDEEGVRELGGCRVVAPWEGTHVTLAVGLPSGYVGERSRMQKLMAKAHRQFMPRAVNVIIIASSFVEDVDDFETALLGSHIERWDAIPPRGRRIAHGRAADGFWVPGHFTDSNAAGWFLFDPLQDDFRSRLYIRPDSTLADAMKSLLIRDLDTHSRKPHRE